MQDDRDSTAIWNSANRVLFGSRRIYDGTQISIACELLLVIRFDERQ